jgi:hypothetical protein
MRRECRPSLAEPTSCVGLFSACDLHSLLLACYWPLPAPARDWLARPPGDETRRRNRRKLQITAVVREVLAAELPEAFAYLLGRKP